MTAIFSRMMATAVNPADYIPLPAAKDEPCHLCGRRPTSSVRRGGGGVYLCYDCLITAKRPAKVQSLPGVLDHRTFTRTKVELGRCDVYGMGRRCIGCRRRRRRVAKDATPGWSGSGTRWRSATNSWRCNPPRTRVSPQHRISDTPGTEDVPEAGISLLQNLFHPLVQI
jgi:hypothetical protein